VVKNIATNTTQEDQQPPYYETFISIDNPVFEISQVRPEVIPGMQVTVDIIGGKRTVLDYILSPIKRASKVAFREI
jgi:multidrug efflux pump subunit AcrA (membrane-fusion protein)